METISRLRALLLESFGANARQSTQHELFEELMVHKQRLLKVLDVGPRDAQELREIESGKTTINGKSVGINNEFAKQVVFLSQHLECSERYIASVLHAVMSKNPNVGAVSCLELTVSEFHERRRHVADSLRFLLEAAEAAESVDASPILRQIEHFVRQELIPPVIEQGGEISIAQRIFQEMQNLGHILVRAEAARRGAKTNTVVPSGQEQPSLGANILSARCESLKAERRNLATSFFLCARLGYFSPNEVKSVVEWLLVNPNHGMTYYVLASILATLDTVEPESTGGRLRSILAHDKSMITYMSKKLAAETEWKDPGLKAVVLMKWTLFLTEFRHRNPEIENREGFRTEELEAQIRQAVQGDAFTFTTLSVLQLQRQFKSSTVSSILSSMTPSPEQLESREIPYGDFHLVILRAFECLVRSLITHASSELRKIKQRQEDIVLAGTSDRPRHGSRFFNAAPPEPTTNPRNDIAIFYSFIGLLYSHLPAESALQFWGSGSQVEHTRSTYLEFLETSTGRLPSFLQWAVWTTQAQDIVMSTALYDMLAGLSTGQQCSELAYNFLARGGNEVIPGSSLPPSSPGAVSWDIVFGLLDAWTTGNSNNTRSQAPPQLSGPNHFGGSQAPPLPPPIAQPIIGLNEVHFAQGFLRLLASVVTHSVAVRVAICGNVHFRAIPTLVSLIPLGVPLELKGAIFETLSAFCQPGGGASGIEICGAVWTLMERLEVINVRGGGTLGFGAPFKGVEVELEEIEAVHGLYPATIPFLKLLSTLIHTPKRIPLRDRIADAVSINTIPDSLGQPYRLPGIGPFTAFVIDNILSRIHAREFLRQTDRWEMNDLSLAFIERALASYNLEALLEVAERGKVKPENVMPLLVHPGYDVMKRLLTTSSLQERILFYVMAGVEGFDKGVATEEPYFQSSIVRVLRIVHRVLEIQDIFLDILVPILPDFNSAPVIGTVHQQSYFTRFDKVLSFNPHYPAALAAYVAFPAHSELILLAVKITTLLSSSSSFHNLGSLIERSTDSERILAGFIDIITTESAEDIDSAEIVMAQHTGAGAGDTATSVPLAQATRLAALDLLIENTISHRPFPNIAHFLLFGSSKERQIQDPHALGAGLTCVHVILQLLNAGIPSGTRLAPQGTALFLSIPALAERCYRIIYQLCVHQGTTQATMRYLRTRENFFLRHLSAIPSQVPETIQEACIQVLYQDGSRVVTTVAALSAFLRARSCILDLVALELHMLTSKGNQKGISDILKVLFGHETVTQEPAAWEDEVLVPFREVGQSHMRVIELVSSLAFDWADSLTVEPAELQFLAQLNIHTCARKDNWGCEIIDRNALLALLTTARRGLHTQNAVLTPTNIEQLNAETTYIMESCALENHRRQIVHATSAGFQSWRRLLETTLSKCFDRLADNVRESVLFDLLHVLPPMTRTTDLEESTTILISEVILSSITKLREDRRRQILIQSASGDSGASALPAERLQTMLRTILECILDNNRVELVRGNLYAALINYIHLISSDADPWNLNASPSLLSSLSSSTASSLASQASLRESAVGLQFQSLALTRSVMERLVTTISRDAIDGTEVWKTVSFMLLDSLAQLSGMEKQHVLLASIVKQGILGNFVHGIKESDIYLQSVLKPDPDDLNPLYVYEAKMSFFNRLGQTRLGAERLLDAQLILVLGQCDYLDARPEADRSFMDDSFLPSAIQRYHQLFMPALQLLNVILSTLGSKHTTASSQALEFLSAHSSTIVILLRNDFDDVSVGLVEEIHLLVSLCASALPLVPKSELGATNSGFGAIHSAILNLATRCLGNERWLDGIKPQNDTEMHKASVAASVFTNETIFDKKVRQLERMLRKALVAYLGIASDYQDQDINIILSPLVTAPRHDERASQFLATIPSIGDALAALNDLSGDLYQTLRQMSDIAAELAARDHIAIDGVSQILDGIDPQLVQNLTTDQKRALACCELERIHVDLQDTTATILQTIEMMLLLLWRHFLYYSEGQKHGKAELTGSTAQAMRFLSTPDPLSFRAEVGKTLGPILQRLQSFDLVSMQEKWTANEEYLEIMCRRLRDAAALHEV